ncbi:DUF6022 family protein [Microseira wollei]|uniref:Uncharacterized protein n=1 Tax=Microseira wollei NIES-4236 TaxID=2530354 RepID=A0AAV3WEP2_9CYAN|nr:DUF6022 family protein [Microseira wollei]GET35814.1 hypothetical protein MiSe_05600 [Microseira wollei NIES-4236]
MASLQEFLAANQQRDILAIAQYIEAHIALNWQTLIHKNIDKLVGVFNKAGDMAYGMYLGWLFLPIHKQLKQAQLRPEPRFPGDFNISREWGNQEQTDQQRWMWSTIESAEGKSLGTIVTITFHDHTQFRIPQKPQIIALTETSKEAVVETLSQRSADFKNALEFQIEYADYLRNLERV